VILKEEKMRALNRLSQERGRDILRAGHEPNECHQETGVAQSSGALCASREKAAAMSEASPIVFLLDD
jgi:hypothetical protein